MKLLFFDTETTGLPNRMDPACGRTHSANGQPRPVQIGWIITDEKGTVLSRKNLFIRPDDFTMPEAVSQFNGIYNEDLKEKGLDEHDVLKTFVRDLHDCDMEVGHNVSFDRSVIGSRLEELGYTAERDFLKSQPAMDTMIASKEWFNHIRGKFPKLTELYRKLFGRDFDGAHDAMADITATMNCFFELIRIGVIHLPGKETDPVLF